MKKLMTLLMAVPLFVFWIAQASDPKGKHGVSINTNDEAISEDCAEHLRMHSDDFRSIMRDEETRRLPNQPLTISAEHNGGIQVTTWDQPEFSLKLCKQVATRDESESRRVLSETKIAVNGGNVSITAPSSDDDHSLGTLLMVKAPRNATVDLSVHNGGISLTNFTGTATAHAHNGGISLRRSTGKLVAEAQNGGVSIKDCGGDISANVRNGGLSISVPEHWEGKGLEAHAQNGGLALTVPKNLRTGVEVTASDHTTIICKDDACTGAERTWDAGHKVLRMGGPNPQVRASTVNGGIVIEEQGHKRGEL